MSYPGAVGYPTNLACDTSLQRSTDTFNFQLNTGAAGESSTLQSPASIIPGPLGASTLLIPNAAGGGDALLRIQDTTGNIANLEIINTAGGNSAILMGTSGSGAQILINAPSLANQGKLLIEGATATYVSVDTVSNNVTLADLGAVGTINLNAATVIKDFTSGSNGLALSPTSSTQSVIGQACGNSGILSIGSSLSNVTSLQVADLAGDGTVYIRSADGAVPLAIRSNNTGSSIIPGTANSGNITIGSSALNPSGLTITDTATTINKLGGAPQVLLATGNLAPGTVPAPTSFSFPAPTGEGLYAIVGSSSGVSTANSRSAQQTSICYVGPTGVVAIGGAAYADVGSIGSDDCIEFGPINNNVFNGSYTGGQQVNNFSVLAFKLSGPIPGTF